MKVLIIGSSDHDRATCLDWMAPIPNIEEFDAMIVNLTSLDEELFQKMLGEGKFHLRSQSEQVQRLVGNGGEVFCIISPHIYKRIPKGSPAFGRLPSNYDWLFCNPKFKQLKGSSITITEAKMEPYLTQIVEWQFVIDGVYPDELEGFYMSSANNKAGRSIAGRITIPLKGSVYLVPPVTKVSMFKGIEILLDIILGMSQPVRPAWWSKVELPFYNKLSGDIATIDSEIKKLEESRTKLEQEKKSLEEYRNLLSTQGEELVTIVQKVLEEFGLQTERTLPGFVVDLLKEGYLAVEVTGIADKVDSDTDKIFQLMQFLEKYHNGEKILLVANTYRRLAPKDRKGKQDFTPNVLDYLKLQDICVMSTLTLFEYWKWSYDDGSKRQTVREQILTTKGELKFTEKS